MPTMTEEYFVLRAGATQEERWTRDEISERCRSGEFGADTQVYLQDESRWVPVGETEFGTQLGMLVAESSLREDDESPAGEAEDDESRAAREEMEAAYADAVYAVEGNPTGLDPLINAGSLACDLGDIEAARGHFQRALQFYPFHRRVAQEVKRRFSPSEARTFDMLERPDAPWEDLLAVASFPFRRGVLYAGVLAALFTALLFVPAGEFAVGAIALLVCYRCVRTVASGKAVPPGWRRYVDDPVPGLVFPFAVMAGVLVEWLVVFWVFALVYRVESGFDHGADRMRVGVSPGCNRLVRTHAA